jgi:hypothetical protein
MPMKGMEMQGISRFLLLSARLDFTRYGSDCVTVWRFPLACTGTL